VAESKTFLGRGRLIAIVGFILLAGFAATNLIGYRVSSGALKAAIVQNELPLTSGNIYAEIQTDLLRPIFVSSLMSNDTFLKDWVVQGEGDVGAVTRYLKEIREKYGAFTSFFISARSLNYYHFSGVDRRLNRDNPEDGWFFRAATMAQPYEINIDFNYQQDRDVTIFINYRVLDEAGAFLGVTGVGLKLDTVANIISRYRDNFRNNIYFVDGDGRITVRSAGAVVTEPDIRHAAGISAIADRILSVREGYFEYRRDGETMLLTARLIPELGWRVIVEQRESEAMRSLRGSLFTNFAIGALIIVLTIALVAYAVNLYNRRLEDMAVTDKLTGLGNREMFDRALERALERRRRSADHCCVILVDVDHFKLVNDKFGHLKGDEAIRRIGQAVQGAMRGSDLVCRWGGEELIALARGCRLRDAADLAEKVRQAVADAALFLPDRGVRVTISAGVAEILDGDTADKVIDRADLALYRAKSRGRNRVELESEADRA
jgi:diguanylate cyclase (GGDEF)-like protein